jgi:Tfp pilus assembly protein PilW
MTLVVVVGAWVLVLVLMARERRMRARRQAWERDRERRAEALAARSLRPYGHVEAAPIEPPIAWEAHAPAPMNGGRKVTSE